jgi:membrane protein implicated in regulation of membrane protease activity
MMEKENQNLTFIQRVKNLWRDLKQTNLRAQTHYMVFRTTQNIKQKNDLLTRYKQRFANGWEKWLGIGAGITGLLMLLNPDGIWRWQIVLILLGILCAPLLADLFAALKHPFTEYPGKQLIGQILTLEQAMIDGKGSIRLDNQTWQLAGTDCPAETKVKVIAINDRTLYITPVKPAA